MVNLLTNFRQSAAEGVGVKTVRLVTCGLECSVGDAADFCVMEGVHDTC